VNIGGVHVERIGRYTVDRELGRGGMARAVLAHTDDGAAVVLKIPLRPDAETFGRLREEARVGIRVNHPNLIQTLDLIEHDGMPVLVVSYVDGVSVHALTQKGRLPADAVAVLGADVASALHAIHSATDEHGVSLGIVHRDVSVANILVTRKGEARLIDLGLARSTEALHKTQTGMLLGTLPYFAPELLEESPYSPASDMWAFGCVLFEAATAKRLFTGRNEGAVVGKIMTGDPMDHEGWKLVSQGLAGVLQRLLVRDPTLRLSDARSLEQRLTVLGGTTGRQALAERVRAVMPKEEAPFDEPTFKETLKLYMGEDQVVPFSKDPKSGEWHGDFTSLPSPDDVDRVRERLFDLKDVVDERRERVAQSATTADPFRPPKKVDEGLELARPRPATNPGDFMPTLANPYPTSGSSSKKRSAAPAVLGVVVVALVVGVLGYLWMERRNELLRLKAVEDAARALRVESEINALLTPAENAPPCYQLGKPALYVYKDAKGANVVVERIEDVPLKGRHKARCVHKD